MVDPIMNLLNALYLILERLPGPFLSLLGVVAVFTVFTIIVQVVRNL